MPIYEYECDDCKKTFEVFLSMKDKSITQCMHCCGTNIRKLVSNCSFQLKGTGWYLTDYARKDNKAKESPDNKQNKQNDPASSKNSKASDNKNTDKASASSNTSEKTDAGKAA